MVGRISREDLVPRVVVLHYYGQHLLLAGVLFYKGTFLKPVGRYTA